MKALILCAGYGTRLGDLTKDTPKPMLMLNGKPLLEWLILHLASYGIREIAINLHFMPEVIRNYFADGQRQGVRLHYFQEDKLMGTAGGVKNMAGFLTDDQPFLVQYGDILTDQDISKLAEAHQRNNALATLLLHERKNSNSVVVLDDARRVTAFLERPTEEQRRGITSPWVNSALTICSPEILAEIPSNTICDLPRDVFTKLVNTGRIFGYPLTGYRCAIDSPERLEAARQALVEGRCEIGLKRET